MVLIEGPARMVGRLLKDLYHDQSIDKNLWTVDHKMESRAAYAQHLQNTGAANHRQGIGVVDQGVLNWLNVRSRSYGLKYHLFAKSA